MDEHGHLDQESPSGKSWVPLESNPELLTELSHALGLSDALGWHDVYSIDDPDLLAFVPRPCHALLLVFPISSAYEQKRQRRDEQLKYNTPPPEGVFWFKQTIGNACGTMGLIHALSNGDVYPFVTPTSPLHKFVESTKNLSIAEKAKALESNTEIEDCHRSTATQGQTAAPDATDDTDLHFVCFAKGTNGSLLELDGRRAGYVDHGKLPEGEDLLGEKALELIKEFVTGEGDNFNFSLTALGPL
ncbi:ubiquitin C-terminal hydrolase L3 [Saitoella complicata NRRL Y-17804]|nr:ubiquitin C-terminal hydrolase L3 [Saitoella complicata NRRL Y-17804]ODQ53934.1 ubiquitin C-terminal hydrolase L3 [Saitoella complicata NRRL Y-17804]